MDYSTNSPEEWLDLVKMAISGPLGAELVLAHGEIDRENGFILSSARVRLERWIKQGHLVYCPPPIDIDGQDF